MLLAFIQDLCRIADFSQKSIILLNMNNFAQDFENVLKGVEGGLLEILNAAF